MGDQEQQEAASAKLNGWSDSTVPRRRRSSRPPASTPARVWASMTTFDNNRDDDCAILVRRSKIETSLQPVEHVNAAAALNKEVARKPVVSCV